MEVLKGNVYKNKDGKLFTVLKVKGENDIQIKFNDSGYECRVRKHILLSGDVRDNTDIEDERKSWVPYVKEFTNNSGQNFKSFSRKGKKIKIIFPTTGYSTEVYIDNASAGKVKDPYEISVYGHGYIGLPDKTLSYWKPAFQLWQNMMKRCYSEKDERGYYGECFVDERWKCFENFLNDIKYLEGFTDWLRGNSESYYKSNLDKDFYFEGNRIYSRHYCRFLPQSYNKSLGKKDKTLKDWA
jgi:hypothetical protein